MKVFISWSKPRAGAVAKALHQFLSDLNTAIRPWVSISDISAGLDWNAEIRANLEAADFGIIIVTPENQREPWLLFEAGALSNRFKMKVTPVVYGMPIGDVKPPLFFRNGVECSREGYRSLVESINADLGEFAMGETALTRAFDKWAADLETAISKVPPIPETPKERSVSDKVDEMLGILRSQESRVRTTEMQVVHVGNRTYYFNPNSPNDPPVQVGTAAMEAMDRIRQRPEHKLATHPGNGNFVGGGPPPSNLPTSPVGTRY